MKKILALIFFLSVFAVPVMAVNTTLVADYYPYTEPVTNVLIKSAYIELPSYNLITDANLTFEFNGTNYTMAYNVSDYAYEITLGFGAGDVGNWTFDIYANKSGYDDQHINGTIKVRELILINLRLFKDNNATVYTDNFAQLVLQSPYSCYPMITNMINDSYSGETQYYHECYYHANYTNGLAQVMVHEKGVYDFYLISGVMYYNNKFAYPTIDRQTYNLKLGSYNIRESPTNANIVLNSCDLNPEACSRFYFSMFLWIIFLVIAGIIGIVAGKYAGGGVGFGVAVIVLIGLILLRLALLGY